MGGTVPKVLVPVGGQPMLGRLLDAIEISDVDGKPIVVYGHGLESVRDFVGDRGVCVLQQEQKGTADAVRAAKAAVGDARCVVVVNGDNPFISSRTIQKIAEYHDIKPCPIILAVGTVESFEGWQSVFAHFGRVIRGLEDGLIDAIREAKDATSEELAIKEVNAGFYVFDGPWLWSHIDLLSNQNAQGEFYLTDLVASAVKEGLPVRTFPIPIKECIGINRMEERDIAEHVLEQ